MSKTYTVVHALMVRGDTIGKYKHGATIPAGTEIDGDPKADKRFARWEVSGSIVAKGYSTKATTKGGKS